MKRVMLVASLALAVPAIVSAQLPRDLDRQIRSMQEQEMQRERDRRERIDNVRNLKIDRPDGESLVAIACVSKFGLTRGAAGCVSGALTAAEIEKCYNNAAGGKGCFGNNDTLRTWMQDNWNAARRESDPAAALLRISSGFSLGNIQQHGPLGGPDSDARNACNAVFSGQCP
jgi:hypothetical protein